MKNNLIPGFEVFGFDLESASENTAYVVVDNQIRQWHPATGEYLPCQVTVGQCRRGTITQQCKITRLV